MLALGAPPMGLAVVHAAANTVSKCISDDGTTTGTLRYEIRRGEE